MRHFACPAVVIGLMLAGASAPAMASHAIYQGRIGTSPVTMVIEYGNGVTRGLYFYDRYRTPIRLKPAFLDTPDRNAMDELGPDGLPIARLHFHTTDFFPSTPRIGGSWIDYRSGHTLPLELQPRGFLEDFLRDADSGTRTQALLQAASSERLYFQIPLMLSHDPVTAIEVMDKASGERVQVLAPSTGSACNHGIDTVQVEQSEGRLRLYIDPGRNCSGASFEWVADERRFVPVAS